jgi:DNA-binding transcriptional ArsR family regulator
VKKPDIDSVFHALGDPTRRGIVDKLVRGPQSVTALAGPLGVTLTAIVQHLQVLERAGLVRTEKAGRVRTCSLASEGFDALQQWIRERRSRWEQRLDRLGEILEKE